MSEEQKYSDEDLEAGRLMFCRPWDFLTSVTDMANLPEGCRKLAGNLPESY